MSRESADEFAPDGSLLNGYDYKRQAAAEIDLPTLARQAYQWKRNNAPAP